MNRLRTFIYIAVGLAHAVVLLLVVLPPGESGQKAELGAEVFKLVDVREYIPPPPEEKPPPEETVEVSSQDSAAANVVETDKTVLETAEPNYVPQHLITGLPVLPSEEILENIVYPELAARQGLEGVVYLELFIDAQGLVRRVSVLRDPGHGFAAAAVKAVEGIRVRPASVDGQPVAVRFRYPVRFTLK